MKPRAVLVLVLFFAAALGVGLVMILDRDADLVVQSSTYQLPPPSESVLVQLLRLRHEFLVPSETELYDAFARCRRDSRADFSMQEALLPPPGGVLPGHCRVAVVRCRRTLRGVRPVPS